MQPILYFTLSLDHAPCSMNQAIREQNVSQAMRRRLRREGSFLVNGVPATWDTLLHPGDSVAVHLSKTSHIDPTPMDLDIVFEDNHLLVINKPAGMLMHPTSSERYHTLANGVLAYFEKQSMNASFHPIHRLDKDTSGLVIIAKNALVQHAFTKQHSRIQKVYDAITDGIIPVSKLSIHFPIARLEGSIIERCAHPLGQPAHTDIDVVRQHPHHTHVRCYLHTGRTHQIRVHLSALGYPLAGDDLYGGSLTWQTKQCLHATELHFIHPMTQEWMSLQAPLPEYFKQIP
ncbi:RluA family pseudouridine synthase [Veillonella sp. CNR 79/14]|uniref:RluA family pseudouridine synthase n=1 Tax=Veillonella sp. CNR 79/14 TaxID=2490954 RepID=UPI000F8D593C|nr:RluA family pseudouridine synthase [Veillonella sp. CNR 79/14]